MADGVPTMEEWLALSGELYQGQPQSLAGNAKDEPSLTYAAMQVPEQSFAWLWDNPEDNIYNVYQFWDVVLVQFPY